MGRTLLTIVLLVAVTQAQMRVSPVSQPQPTRMDPADPNLRWLEAIPQYGSLRRGSEEKILLAVSLNPTSYGTTYWGTPSPAKGPVIPTALTIDAPEMFTVSSIEYPTLRKVTGPGGREVRLLGPDSIDLHFKLRAGEDVALGDHLLKGRLRFQRVGQVGISLPQDLEFSIPIQVVDHNAKVAKESRYRQTLTPIQITGLVLLSPLAIPFGIFMVLIGWDGC